MKYYTTIISLFSLSFITVVFLLYLANISKKLEFENKKLKNEITFIEDQININQIEYSLYNSYEYIERLSQIYFDENYVSNFPNQVIYIDELDNQNFKVVQKVSTK